MAYGVMVARVGLSKPRGRKPGSGSRTRMRRRDGANLLSPARRARPAFRPFIAHLAGQVRATAYIRRILGVGKAACAPLICCSRAFAPVSRQWTNPASGPSISNSLIYLGYLERARGFEPPTPTLARLCSTPELHPHPAAAGRSAARSHLSPGGWLCKACVGGRGTASFGCHGPAADPG